MMLRIDVPNPQTLLRQDEAEKDNFGKADPRQRSGLQFGQCWRYPELVDRDRDSLVPKPQSDAACLGPQSQSIDGFRFQQGYPPVHHSCELRRFDRIEKR